MLPSRSAAVLTTCVSILRNDSVYWLRSGCFRHCRVILVHRADRGAILGGAERWAVGRSILFLECADVGLSGQHGDPSAPAATESAALATYGAIACFMRLIACVARLGRLDPVGDGHKRRAESQRSSPKTLTRPAIGPRRRWRWPVPLRWCRCVRNALVAGSKLIDQFFITLAGEFDQPGENFWVVKNCPCSSVKICDARRLNATMVSMSPVISLLLVANFCAMTWAARLMASVSVIVSLLALDRFDDAIGADVQARGELFKGGLLPDLLRAFGAGVVQVPRDLID